MRLIHRARRCAVGVTSEPDAGFSLAEVLIAIFLVSLVMGASIAFFINNLKGVSGQGQRQQAIYLVDQQLETVQATPMQPTNLLIRNRSQSAVNALLATPVATRLAIAAQDDTSNSGNYDAAATAGRTGDIPTQTPMTINRVAYQMYIFIDVCWLTRSTGICGPTNSAGTTREYRATVDVTWTGGKGGTGCSTGCDYSSSTILDPTADPQFNNNLSTPTITGICFPGNNPCAGAVVNNDNGSPGTQVYVSGSGFKAGATVKISSGGGTINNVAIGVGGSSVTFYLAAGDNPGSYVISVINPDGGHDQTSLTEVPVITSLSPNRIAANVTKTITLTGGGFETGATLTETDPGATVSSFTVTSATTATATWVDTTPGVTTLTLTNPDGSTATTTITTTAVPVITAITPSTVPPGVAKTLTLTGTGFQTTGATLTVTNGTYTGLNVTSTTSATVTFTATANGNATIQMVNSDGGVSAAYTISVAPGPAITSVSPTTSMAHNTTRTYTVTGTNFVNGASITFAYNGGPLAITSVIWVSATQMKFNYTAPNVTGTYPVTVQVTNPDTQASNASGFNLVLT